MKVGRGDILIGMLLVIFALLAVISHSAFVSEYGHYLYLNVDILTFLILILGFAIAISIGDLLSAEVKGRVFGAFLLAVSVFVLIRWHSFFEALPFVFGVIIGSVASGIALRIKKYQWLRYMSALIVGTVAYFYLDYLFFLQNKVGETDLWMLIAFASFIFFIVLIYAILKPVRE
ncbi:hypothetical protein CW713_00085 [Methanophagales archaeon]|nr:MAG: hypothetical protein CW713_00085 [Methanophagales archaeon]